MSPIPDQGFAMARSVLSVDECEGLIAALGDLAGAGRRGLLRQAEVRDWAVSERLLPLIRPFLPEEPRPVRAIYFDKSEESNWLVPWHQDLTIAVRHRSDTPGFGPWSVKNGIPHVQPPMALLEQMMTFRLHLDDADESNGALRVLPASHAMGRLNATHIQALRAGQNEVLCEAAAGDALLMRPLLLHASSRSTSLRHRRVLHIEYAAFELPFGLEWHESA